MDKLILGRYIPGNSLIHRLDPRSKLIAMFLFILIVYPAYKITKQANTPKIVTVFLFFKNLFNPFIF